MNILFAQESANVKHLSTILHNILTFLYFLPHQIGLGIIKLLQQIFPRIVFPDSLVDPLGILILLTLFMILARVAKKAAWIIVWLGWILLFIRILMIIFNFG
jgi:hypothetical protein